MQPQMFPSLAFPPPALLVLRQLLQPQMFPSLAFPPPALLVLWQSLARQLLALPE
jgi:hypothetical protein